MTAASSFGDERTADERERLVVMARLYVAPYPLTLLLLIFFVLRGVGGGFGFRGWGGRP